MRISDWSSDVCSSDLAKHAKRGRRDMIRRSFLLTATAALSIATTAAQPAMAREQWSKEQANTWYDKQPWLVGANYTPGSAVNELEMWHEPTFAPATIDKALCWAAGIGTKPLPLSSSP